VELPQGALAHLLVGLNDSVMVQALQSYGVHLPTWLAQLPALAPELKLLQRAQAGKPNVYAYCFCSPR
jgi:protease-4